MRANRAQACSIFGISRWDFDVLVKDGFPAVKKGGSRGLDWSIDTIEAHKFLVERAVQAAAPAVLPPAIDGAVELDSDRELARLRKEQADKLERERLLDEQRLMTADLVREALSRCFSSVNTKLGALPSKLAHVLRPDDPRTARRHLELAVEEMRAELRAVGVRGVEGWEGEPRH